MVHYLTKNKKKELEEELEKLLNEGRQEIAERLDEAKALGDLKENAEYHQAREDQGKMEDRINQIKEILKDSEIIKKTSSDEVQIGSVVLLEKDGEKIEYSIVGREEVDILNNKIAIDSPLVKEMLGRGEGEDFIFVAPDGRKHNYKIVKIS